MCPLQLSEKGPLPAVHTSAHRHRKVMASERLTRMWSAERGGVGGSLWKLHTHELEGWVLVSRGG